MFDKFLKIMKYFTLFSLPFLMVVTETVLFDEWLKSINPFLINITIFFAWWVALSQFVTSIAMSIELNDVFYIREWKYVPTEKRKHACYYYKRPYIFSIYIFLLAFLMAGFGYWITSILLFISELFHIDIKSSANETVKKFKLKVDNKKLVHKNEL